MYNCVPSISDAILKELIAEIDDNAIRGIVLGDSHARGNATPYSDVDQACFVPDAFRPLCKRFLYREGHLISIGLKTLEDVKQQLECWMQGEKSSWVASGTFSREAISLVYLRRLATKKYPQKSFVLSRLFLLSAIVRIFAQGKAITASP
jgi:hypothetical protein